MDLEALLRDARDDKPGAWKALHQRLRPELRLYFLSQKFDESTAADLTQRTLSLLFEKLPGFEPRKGSIKNWVFGIARNLGLLEYRARTQTYRALEGLATQLVKTQNTSPTAERLCIEEDLIEILLEEIQQLPSRLRRVVEQDLERGDLATPERRPSLEKFAKQEGIRPGTVWSRRHQAMKILRERITARVNRPPPRPLPAAPSQTASSSSSAPTPPS